jgi:agmatine deiminase
MPAEWEPHQATWLTWPRPDGISFPDRYDAVPPVYAEFIRHLIQGEEVHINVWDENLAQDIRKILAHHAVPMDRVHLHFFQAYEPWCRDHGPMFVVKEGPTGRERAVVDWDYNAWGDKYPPYDLDDAIPQHVATLRNLRLFQPGIIMEGGALDVNGAGTLLTTESCLLNPNRNPGLSRAQIETALRDYLNVDDILWLGDGIEGDDTDGHVDDLTRFVDPGTVVTVVEEDPADPNYLPLQENLSRLRAWRDRRGQGLKIVPLPCPGRVELDGQRLPASYANFYIANAAVILPTFRHPNDKKAQAILQSCFPDRPVMGVDSTDLIWGLGSFHCISQQEPAE